MQRFPAILFFLVLSLGSLSAQQNITLENIWLDYTFLPRSVPGFNFLNDGQHYTRLERNQIQQYDIRTGDLVQTILDGEGLDGFAGGIDSYSFSADEGKILLSNGRESIYRHSFRAGFFVYDRAERSLTPVFEGEKVRLATFSPAGDKVAFVYQNNVYYQNLATGEIRAVTTDGEINAIINGAADWVYEEEFGEDRGLFWSPDGQRLAFYRFDEREVPEFTLTNYHDDLYPEYVTFKYPKVGAENSDVSIHIYDLASETTREVMATDENWEYVPRIKWTNNPDQLCVFRMNRHQSELELRLVDATTGDQRTLLHESNEAYIDIHDNLTFLANGEQFIWTSEQDGWNHVYLYGMDGQLDEQLTSGEWEVSNFYGFDEDRGLIYFQAAKEHPTQREVYSLDIKSGALRTLSTDAGWTRAQFSSTFAYYTLTYSNINTPATYTVFDRSGNKIRVIEDNAALRQLQATYGVQPAEFFSFTTDADVELNGYMIKPANFDERRRYPVLMFVYGGPGSQDAIDSWRGQNYWWFQMLAQQGYLIACVDNRGTAGRGEEFKKMTYLQLGKYETEDQIAAAVYLGDLPYVDARRIGIFGWSYGGYMSSLCILKGNNVFKAAIAVAPVTNWKWYDSIYTERYMRTTEENEEGYRDNSPVYFADRLRGNYLLVHGMGDDNVHFQHTAEMANALISANKQYDTYFYPNRNHGIYGGYTRLHLYTRMTNFLNEKLKGETRGDRPAGTLRIETMEMEKSRN
ncbi:MAG: S9 family peptidase [Lewinella sp.]|nr:S9 family peptidase [Lewinella sp.]